MCDARNPSTPQKAPNIDKSATMMAKEEISKEDQKVGMQENVQTIRFPGDFSFLP
jgi:hypothetical protein